MVLLPRLGVGVSCTEPYADLAGAAMGREGGVWLALRLVTFPHPQPLSRWERGVSVLAILPVKSAMPASMVRLRLGWLVSLSPRERAGVRDYGIALRPVLRSGP